MSAIQVPPEREGSLAKEKNVPISHLSQEKSDVCIWKGRVEIFGQSWVLDKSEFTFVWLENGQELRGAESSTVLSVGPIAWGCLEMRTLDSLASEASEVYPECIRCNQSVREQSA